ncbi:hypothetical protein MMC25_001084 [Agyrium rufum]|nr:hypothetical protein [Agyrium rufum]
MGVYRVELASTARAGCVNTECKEKALKIDKGELRCATQVTIKEHTTWKWRHWGCVTPTQIENIKEAIEDNLDYLDGYDEVNADSQAKIRKAFEDGHVADEEWKGDLAMNRPGKKGFRSPAAKKAIRDAKKAAKEDEEAAETTPIKAPSKKHGRGKENDAEDDEEPMPTKKRKPSSKTTKKADGDGSEGIGEGPRMSKAKLARKSRKAAVKTESDAEEEEELPKAAKRISGRTKKARTPKVEEESDDDEAPIAAPKASETRARRKAAKAAVVEKDSDEDEEVLPVEKEEEEQPVAKAKRGKATSKGGSNGAKFSKSKCILYNLESLVLSDGKAVSHDCKFLGLYFFRDHAPLSGLSPPTVFPSSPFYTRYLSEEPEENIHSIPARNTLDINKQSPMRQSQSYNPFDEDGPGTLSQLGPRHDNDHVSITNIRILPTTDEILSDRKPYMPIADYTNDKHDWSRTVGPQRMIVRVIDKNFRQLRYDSINCIIKACRDAMRMLLLPSPIQQGKEYAVTNQTTCGTRFHLFRGVIFEELLFHDRKGINFRVSFDCPPSLRSHRIHHKSTKLLENGKLVALVGIEKVSGNLTTTFFEIHMRESTDAMHSTTGNHDRAAVQLTLADRDDVESLRKMLYFQKGILEGKFALIDFADFLLTGFAPHLQCLKSLASWPTIAFDDTIAPECHESVVVKPIEPPSYAAKNFFKFDLSGLRTSEASKTDTKLEIDAAAISRSGEVAPAILSTIKSETTLDDGQAQALVEMLCRGIAFTQGPPGTGKSFLGVALSKVLLDSQDFQSQKPIVVVCKTNHALDSFLEDLLKKGIKDIIRIGQAGDKEWAAQFQLHAQTTKLRLPQSDYNKLASANRRLHEISREALSWIENLNSETLGWAILRDHLRVHHPTFYTEFVKFEIANKNVRDLRKVRHFKGFAFDYWVRGGDLDDVDGILDAVATLLKESNASMSSEYSARFQEQVLGNMRSSISGTSDVSSQSVWGLKVAKRQTLTKQWIKEMDATKLCDSMTEMHRRHQELLRSSNTHWDSKKSLMLSTKEVVGLTTTGFAQHYDLLRTLQPRIILMEEAAEVLEAHTLLTLGFTSIEHHLSIGDPLQLRPQNEESVLSTDNAIGKKYRLDESLFERLMKPTSSSYPAVPVSQLNIQRRMHPDVADISRATLYDYLVDHESTRSHPEVAGMSDRMYWFDHCVPEDPPCPGTALAGSSSNEFEVDMTVALVKYLSSTGAYGLGDIAIVTAYNRQLARLTLRLQRECNVKVWLSETDKELLIDRGILDEEALSTSEQDIGLHNMLRVATIDGFQGEEAKVVIFSTVRSNSTSTVGFLSNINRVNVACSRARDGFYVIGNASAVGHGTASRPYVPAIPVNSFMLACHRAFSRFLPAPKYAEPVYNADIIVIAHAMSLRFTISCRAKNNVRNSCHVAITVKVFVVVRVPTASTRTGVLY